MPAAQAPTTIVVHFHARPGRGRQLRDVLMQDVPKLTDLAGCRGGSLYHDLDEPDLVVLIEHWDSVDAHKAYIQRIETDGTMERLMPFLSGPPLRKYLAPA